MTRDVFGKIHFVEDGWVCRGVTTARIRLEMRKLEPRQGQQGWRDRGAQVGGEKVASTGFLAVWGEMSCNM